ncbi:hypothetical protein BDV06DRAFT_225091 [Aspergillus oleicola]
MARLLLYLALGLAALQLTTAQSCSSVTITSQSDADTAFNDCSDISGSVTISPSAQGTLNLDGLEQISENFIVEDTSLVGITLPDIENVGGSVSVTGNEALTRLGLSGLAGINGDLNVKGNNALVDLSMDDLETIRGGMHLDGGFNTLSFEMLERVGRESDIVSTGSAGCSGIDSLNSSGEEEAEGEVFQGSYTCQTTSASPSSTSTSTSTSTSSPTSTGTDAATNPDSDEDSGLSGGAIAGIVVGVVVGVIIFLVLIWLFLRERRKNRGNLAALGAGASSGAAAAVLATSRGGDGNRDEEKQPSQSTSPTSTTPNGAAALAAIPRRPLSTSTAPTTSPTSTNANTASTLPSSLTAGSAQPSSMPMPTALIPGTNNTTNNPRNIDGTQNDTLFLNTTPAAARGGPQRRPSEFDVPMLDSGDVHEVSGVSRLKEERTGERIVSGGQVFELDGGFEGARHQRPLRGEESGDGDGEREDGDTGVEKLVGPQETGVVTRAGE